MDWRKNFVPALLKIFKKKHLGIIAQVCVSVCLYMWCVRVCLTSHVCVHSCVLVCTLSGVV